VAGASPIVLERDHTAQGVNTPSKVVTAQTVKKMAEHIRNALADPLLNSIVRSLSVRPNESLRSAADQLVAFWTWVKHHIRFVHDDTLILGLLNERDHFELLISPPVLLRMRQPQGDCDDFTMLLLAMCAIAGFPVRIVTMACDRNRPGEYSHVSGEAQLPDGTWCPMDASHGTHPGWEVPAFDIQRRTSWDLDGAITEDRVYSPAEQAAARAQLGMGEFSLGELPKFDTGLPVIGTIDLSNPMEWLFWGGAVGSVAFMKEPTAKLVGAVGFIGARFILGQLGASV
jgi:hypothetical protein